MLDFIFLDFEPEGNAVTATRLAIDSCKIKWYNRFTDGKNVHIFEFFAVGMFVIHILSQQQSTVTKKFAILLILS